MKRTACRSGTRSNCCGPILSLAARLWASRRSSARTVRSLPAPVALDADDAGAAEPGRSTTTTRRCSKSPEALAYLRARGLDHPELIDALQARLCQPHAGPAPAGQERARPAPNCAARLQQIGMLREQRPRALQRLAGGARVRRRRPRDRGLRPQDPRRPAHGHAAAPVPAGPAPRRVERARRCAAVERDHPVRSADRRA